MRITGQFTLVNFSRLFLATGILSLILLPGCGGCGGENSQPDKDKADKDSTKTEDGTEKDKEKDASVDKEKDKNKDDKDKSKDKGKDKKKEKPKPPPDFDPPKMAVLPYDTSLRDMSSMSGIKPGHWGTAVLEMKANNFDFSGELDSWLINAEGRQIGLPGLPYQVVSRRPAILPKGQKKFFEVSFFAPPPEDNKNPKLYTRLLGRSGGEVQVAPVDALATMPAHQYFFVVLAREPLKYTYIKNLDSISPQLPGEFVGVSSQGPHYRVSIPQVDKRVPLPSHLLAWTSIAYVLWDDINPDVLQDEQKRALVDWLHWGGQLIVSGPDSLTSLQAPGGFLEPYLPATAGESTKIDAETLKPLSDAWSLTESVPFGKKTQPKLTAIEPWVGVQLIPKENADPVRQTNKLFYERRVGRGRIVVSAFRLQQRELVNWRSVDSFFNACLLRRPPRRFVDNRNNGSTDVQLVDATNWTGDSHTDGNPYNPSVNTNVRFLGRDTVSKLENDPPRTSAPSQPTDQDGPRFGKQPATDIYGNSVEDFNTPPDAGLGGWSDFNSISSKARKSLTDAAGIEIPKASFVISCLAAYLFVLVPVNWTFFKLIGRVEWAWIAAPVLAILGTVFVTKMAHLDIGFTRSERELALVELHAGHSRAHVTRYTALYTSLSSSYRVACDDPSSEILPFSTSNTPNEHPMLIGQSRTQIEFRREEQTSLTGCEVSSNATGMIHSEQIADLGGAIQWKKTLGKDGDLVNGTKFDLRSAGVIRRRNGQYELAWIGDLAKGTIQPLKFVRIPSLESPSLDISGQFFPEVPKGSDAYRENQWLKGAVLSDMFKMLSDEKQFRNGDVRLFGWTDQEIPGVTFDPVAAQVRRATLVVAQLDYASFPAAVPDKNLKPLRDQSVEE